MKIQRLSANEKKTPDFVDAITVIFIILFFSVVVSVIAGKMSVISTDAALSFLWGIFGTFLTTGILLCYIFLRFKAYLLKSFKNPQASFSKGFFIYLSFLPFLFLITLSSFALSRLIGLEPIPQRVLGFYLETDSFYLLSMLFIASCVVAPVAEEIIFRGIVYPGLKERFSVFQAVTLSSFIFALLHGEIFVFAGLFAFGILLAVIFEKNDNLWLPISVHFYNNLFANIAVFLVKYTGIMKI